MLSAVVTALAATPAARQQQRQQPGVQLQPTVATSNPKLTSTNLLSELDQATQQVIGVDSLCLRLMPLVAYITVCCCIRASCLLTIMRGPHLLSITLP